MGLKNPGWHIRTADPAWSWVDCPGFFTALRMTFRVDCDWPVILKPEAEGSRPAGQDTGR